MKELAKIIIEGAQERIQFNSELAKNPPKYSTKEICIGHVEDDKRLIVKWSKFI